MIRFRQDVLASNINNHTDNKNIVLENFLFLKMSYFLPISSSSNSYHNLVFQKLKLDAYKENCKAQI